MKFKRDHTVNGVKYKAGEHFTGDVRLGRFLFQRGQLEADGSPEDKKIMADASEYKEIRWAQPEEPKPATKRRRTKKEIEHADHSE